MAGFGCPPRLISAPQFVASFNRAPHRRLRSSEMKGVSEILQLAVIIKWRRPLSFEAQMLEKLDFVLGRIAVEGSIPKKFFQTRFFVEAWVGFPFQKRECLRGPRGQSAV